MTHAIELGPDCVKCTPFLGLYFHCLGKIFHAGWHVVVVWMVEAHLGLMRVVY